MLKRMTVVFLSGAEEARIFVVFKYGEENKSCHLFLFLLKISSKITVKERHFQMNKSQEKSSSADPYYKKCQRKLSRTKGNDIRWKV
jgi:hypothetical protein